MTSLKITVVVGARPNFRKASPILESLSRRHGVSTKLVHTGQHYDRQMSGVFFEELGLAEPDVYLGVGSGTHAEQTGAIMTGFERVLEAQRPDTVVVVGDVNSTMACAVTAAKAGVPVAHVEAGLRSFDRSMPEEINRIITDSLSQFLLTTEESANRNLRAEGHSDEEIRFVGNVMIDTLNSHVERATGIDARAKVGLPPGRGGAGPADGDYALMTLHRPSNVDRREVLKQIMEAVGELSRELPVVFPVHPRTAGKLEEFGVASPDGGRATGIVTSPPLGYLDFLSLMRGARMVLTDSGGMQDETTALGVPCLTLRENTERPVTVEVGTSLLVGSDRDRILSAARDVLEGRHKKGALPPLWDGRAAIRIADVLVQRTEETQG